MDGNCTQSMMTAIPIHLKAGSSIECSKEAQSQFSPTSDSLKALTLQIGATYRSSVRHREPQVFTVLSEPFKNGGFDNADGDLICRSSDVIFNPEGLGYELQGKLGQGTFGQVLRCCTPDGRIVAVKVIKNKPAYFQQALVELRILQSLSSFDTRVVRMQDYFVFRKHLCIVFELLGGNLYEVLRAGGYRGLDFALLRAMTLQLVKALTCLKLKSVIHSDLKPENILTVHPRSSRIKLIDFGSAAFVGQACYTYIQSRFYRSPEVILGIHPFTPAIDVWSLGCIVGELFLGIPFFPGSNEFDQLCRIIEVLGPVPVSVIEKGKHWRKFYKRVVVQETFLTSESKMRIKFPESDDWLPLPVLKHASYLSVCFEPVCENSRIGVGFILNTTAEFEAITGKTDKPSKRYGAENLRDSIFRLPQPEISSAEEREVRERIFDFMRLCFEFDPEKRICPAQLLDHPIFGIGGESVAGVALRGVKSGSVKGEGFDSENLEISKRWQPRPENQILDTLFSDSGSFLYSGVGGGIAGGDCTLPTSAVTGRPPSAPLPSKCHQQAPKAVPLPDDSMPVSYRPPLLAILPQQQTCRQNAPPSANFTRVYIQGKAPRNPTPCSPTKSSGWGMPSPTGGVMLAMGGRRHSQPAGGLGGEQAPRAQLNLCSPALSEPRVCSDVSHTPASVLDGTPRTGGGRTPRDLQDNMLKQINMNLEGIGKEAALLRRGASTPGKTRPVRRLGPTGELINCKLRPPPLVGSSPVRVPRRE